MKKTIPIGVSSYERMRKDSYYVVDKSNIIQEFLNQKAMVTLITRPRRFGKTLNMSMMAEFFDITKDSKALFADTAIMHTDYVSEMNQYPMIFLTFADAKGTKASIVMQIKRQLLREYRKYKEVFQNLDMFEKPVFDTIMKSLSHMNDGELDTAVNAISFLMEKCHQYYEKKVMLFIDEYDTPFIEAHVHGCYEELHSAMAGMLSSALKDNPYLQYAMLTGIQRVAKENIFSGLNNLSVYTVANKEYAQYFGFTKEETEHLLEYYGLAYSDEVKAMYDGYHIGDVDVYNPWSIVNYARHKELIPYWVNTSSNTMIKHAITDADKDFYQDYDRLLQDGHVDTICNLETSFYELEETSSLWGLFLNAGYLTIEKVIDAFIHKYRIRIPNDEVKVEFRNFAAHYLHAKPRELLYMYEGLKEKDHEKFISNYRSILVGYASMYDLINENSYHILLNICLSLYTGHDYERTSNPEAGKGRADIILKAKRKDLPSYVIELKHVNAKEYHKHPEILQNKCDEAIEQIKTNQYDHDLNGRIIYLALAHSGKDVEMKWVEKKKRLLAIVCG